MKKTSYKCVIDRPLWSHHPKFDHIIYPINYGYIEWIMWWDWEDQDVYILWVNEPLETFEWELIAKIHRANDVEEKRVLAPKWMNFSEKEIKEQTYFQEQYFDSTIEMVK